MLNVLHKIENNLQFLPNRRYRLCGLDFVRLAVKNSVRRMRFTAESIIIVNCFV